MTMTICLYQSTSFYFFQFLKFERSHKFLIFFGDLGKILALQVLVLAIGGLRRKDAGRKQQV